jgi:2-C-methyl-D-erythritol 4-phosphate cytidylyltransferase/2-C-methyl-D-erythritol 2,4-cyclodiphosphate synthase
MESNNGKGIFGLVVAAGAGTRVGGIHPKQYKVIGGESILARSNKPHLNHQLIDGVLVVISKDDELLFKKHCSHLKNIHTVYGGDDRQESVRAGLEFLVDFNPEYVLIHDAARPFLSTLVIDRVLDKLETEDCVIPVLKIYDTLKRIENERIIATSDRATHVKAQTPQGFKYFNILEAHRNKSRLCSTDDSGLIEGTKHSLATVKGSEALFKITYESDVQKASNFINSNYEYRTGSGYDVHRLGNEKPLILCGVNVPHKSGLIGHSDADVSLHAATDALLGAMAEGDIGEHFPPSEKRWKDSPSDIFLRHALELLSAKKGEIVNLDLTIICETPKISQFKPLMRKNLSELLQTPIKNINVKATTTEGLGAMGRKEGIATHATVTIRLPI